MESESDFYEHQLGPDYIIPAGEFCTWKRNGATRINLKMAPENSPKPISIPSAFKQTVEKHGDLFAFHLERDGIITKMTYKQFYEQVRIVAKAFIKLGLKRFNCASILGFNSPEYIIAEIATIFAGGLAAGIYPTNSPAACKYVLQDSTANICLVDNETRLKKILDVNHQLPQLKTIIQWLGKPKVDGVLSWEDIIEIGKNIPDEVLEKRLKGIAINQPCVIVYTSGTTGQPKGVLLNHDNLVFGNWQCFIDILDVKPPDKVISYLPLNHLGGQVLDIMPCILNGQAIYFAKPDALKGSLFETVVQVRPTTFLGVPRIFEKIHSRLTAAEEEMSVIQRTVFSWAKSIGLLHSQYRMHGTDKEPFMYSLANALVFRKVRNLLGLGDAKHIITSTAPINLDILQYFLSLDMFIIECYGLSETAHVVTMNYAGNYRLGSVGKTLESVQCKIIDADESGNGEICFSGRQLFMGYLDKEHDTKEALTEDFWFYTGDVGKLDADGFLYITGRKKELLVTAGGENIAPLPIEDSVKKELNIISNAMAVADKRKFVSVLLTLKTEVDGNGVVNDQLTEEVKIWLREHGSNARTVTDLLENMADSVRLGIQEGIDRANTYAISNAGKMQKWVILPQDFSVATGEIGPTMKLCRHVVIKKYANLINSLYPST